MYIKTFEILWTIQSRTFSTCRFSYQFKILLTTKDNNICALHISISLKKLWIWVEMIAMHLINKNFMMSLNASLVTIYFYWNKVLLENRKRFVFIFRFWNSNVDVLHHLKFIFFVVDFIVYKKWKNSLKIPFLVSKIIIFVKTFWYWSSFHVTLAVLAWSKFTFKVEG